MLICKIFFALFYRNFTKFRNPVLKNFGQGVCAVVFGLCVGGECDLSLRK